MAEQGPQLSRTLLAWYDAQGRSLPWRVKGGQRADPYRVWLSEIMLQQTTVAAVRTYFLDFVARWPTVQALAAAPLDDVLRAWAGLGYYARARNLHACAKAVVAQHGGQFPATLEGLLALPGIGPYTAAAIAAIAFDRAHAAVDGNVERVITRLHAIETPLPQAKPAIRAAAQALVPATRAGDFAQAMMDLGATICTPKSPNCLLCPWAQPCRARALGIAATLPRKAAKKPVPTRHGHAFWLEDGAGHVLLRRRPEKGLLGGMMEVPSSDWVETPPDDDATASAPASAPWRALPGTVEHTFTHFHLVLSVHVATLTRRPKLAGEGWRWVPLADVAQEALPTVMRKVAAHASPQAIKRRRT